MYTMAEAYLLKSEHLTAVVSPFGGELLSLKYQETELIWQGDPAYWDQSAPLLFPFCGRVKDGVYRWQGREYPMPIHGFLPSSRLALTAQAEDALTLTLSDSPHTHTVYPFPFTLDLDYHLTADALTVSATVKSQETPLLFSFGAHPGFRLPLDKDGFGDARLQFDTADPLTRLEITESGLLGSESCTYPIPSGVLPLSPDPAGDCGIFFRIPSEQRQLTLSAPSLPCDIRMEFADFPVLGLWHAEGAPFLCIEPWQGLPALDGIPTDLIQKPETVTLAPHETKTLTISICLLQKG